MSETVVVLVGPCKAGMDSEMGYRISFILERRGLHEVCRSVHVPVEQDLLFIEDVLKPEDSERLRRMVCGGTHVAIVFTGEDARGVATLTSMERKEIILTTKDDDQTNMALDRWAPGIREYIAEREAKAVA